jgi:hypothetical protein
LRKYENITRNVKIARISQPGFRCHIERECDPDGYCNALATSSWLLPPPAIVSTTEWTWWEKKWRPLTKVQSSLGKFATWPRPSTVAPSKQWEREENWKYNCHACLN